MDLFRFTPNPSSPTTLVGGEAINGYLSAMWVERYQDCGEFEIRAMLSSGLREFLPIDTFISHINTLEVMVVENHEIIDEKDADSIIVITGRSLLSILDRRILNFFVKYNTTGNYYNPGGYELYTNYTSYQLVNMINQHIGGSYPQEAIDNINAASTVISEAYSPTRQIKSSEVLKAVIDFLAIEDQGIKTIRRNPWMTSYLPGGNVGITYFVVYKGTDKTKTVIFSYQRGDIEKANYLWTNKDYKNGAILFGAKFATHYDDPAAFQRFYYKQGMLDVSDIEGAYKDANMYDQTTINTIVGKMQSRGAPYLKTRRKTALVQADISPFNNYIYRVDYNMGDLVMVDGNYQLMQVMRVVEHVEATDENGTTAHPTLAIPTG